MTGRVWNTLSDDEFKLHHNNTAHEQKSSSLPLFLYEMSVKHLHQSLKHPDNDNTAEM